MHTKQFLKATPVRPFFHIITCIILSILLLPAAVFSQSVEYEGDDPGLERLAGEIVRLTELPGGTVGVGAFHIESQRGVYINGEDRFPMASTYKVPIAVQMFSKIDRDEHSLSSMITVEEEDLHPGSGTLTRLFNDPGVILSLHNLIELMLLISDNSATDMVMREAGGSAAVTAKMKSLGLDGISVNRPTHVLIGDWLGVEGLQEGVGISPDEFRERVEQLSDEDRKRAEAAFNVDPKDTTTPRDMAKLLTMIWRKEILSEESSDLLIDIMKRCQTGGGRIKGILPPGTVVYNKTGTIGQTLNDIGIIELPDNAGHVVTTLFVKESDEDRSQREVGVSQIARAIYDYFLFNPGK